MAAPAAAPLTASGHTATSLADMMDIAALIEEEKQFIKEKGLVSVRHFRRSFANEEDLILDLIEPFTRGVTIDATEHKSTRPGLAKTCLLVLFDLVQEASAQPQPIFAAQPVITQTAAPPCFDSVGPLARGLARGSRRVGE